MFSTSKTRTSREKKETEKFTGITGRRETSQMTNSHKAGHNTGIKKSPCKTNCTNMTSYLTGLHQNMVWDPDLAAGKIT